MKPVDSGWVWDTEHTVSRDTKEKVMPRRNRRQIEKSDNAYMKRGKGKKCKGKKKK